MVAGRRLVAEAAREICDWVGSAVLALLLLLLVQQREEEARDAPAAWVWARGRAG